MGLQRASTYNSNSYGGAGGGEDIRMSHTATATTHIFAKTDQLNRDLEKFINKNPIFQPSKEVTITSFSSSSLTLRYSPNR